jgi:N-acetylmuramoyl-L-alanine amidase
MHCRILLIALLGTLCGASSAHADLHDAVDPPDQVEMAATLSAEWAASAQGFTSTRASLPGTRVGILLTAAPDAELLVEARGTDEWVVATQTWAGGDDQRILVVDFPSPVSTAQVRVADLTGLIDFAWKLFVPAGEARRLPGASIERSPVLTQELRDIGVIAREDWGALDSECTRQEDTWYRFAIHHTAGNQTGGGTVMGAVQATQAWTMSGGGFCDMPYQFLVGFDGSLWEGRALNLFSGASGAGNNDGNIAVSFMGCYDEGGCNNGGQAAQVVMIAGARLLVETLSAEHFITPTTDNLRGHRQWPNQSTACPGDRVIPRLPEIRSPTAHFEGEMVATSWPDGATLQVGETIEGWVDIENVGLEIWGAGTRLAPLPRDESSPQATDAWISATRISEPESDTSPGETARFPLELTGGEVGISTLSLALVEDGVTWFEDIPIGGGPPAGELILDIEVLAEVPGDDDDAVDDDDSGDPDDPGAFSPLVDSQRRTFAAEGVACACSSGPVSRPAAWLLLILLGIRRRR